MAVKFRDYDEVLGVPRTAAAAEIKRRYRELARKHHPDLQPASRRAKAAERRARRGDQPRDPDPLPPHQEQPRPHRPARRGQDRDRGGPGPADRAGRRPGGAIGASSRSGSRRCSKAVQDAQGGIVLFIDELHTVVGAGAAEGAMDASTLLKPMLARGELHCIGVRRKPYSVVLLIMTSNIGGAIVRFSPQRVTILPADPRVARSEAGPPLAACSNGQARPAASALPLVGARPSRTRRSRG